MTDRYEYLREALAAGPTPGPWFVSQVLGHAVAAVGRTRVCADQPTAVDVAVDADYLAECDPSTIRALLADADRYRAFFASGLPVTYLGQDYRTKDELDAAIDADLAGGDGT